MKLVVIVALATLGFSNLAHAQYDPRRDALRDAARERARERHEDDQPSQPSYPSDDSSTDTGTYYPPSDDSSSSDDSSDDSTYTPEPAPRCDGQSPFKSGDSAIDAAALVGKVFYHPKTIGKAASFTQDGTALILTIFKDGAIVAPYQNLNCGEISRVKGTKGGLACTRGSIEIDIAMYTDKAGVQSLNLAYDTELADWHNTCSQPTFYNWKMQ